MNIKMHCSVACELFRSFLLELGFGFAAEPAYTWEKWKLFPGMTSHTHVWLCWDRRTSRWMPCGLLLDSCILKSFAMQKIKAYSCLRNTGHSYISKIKRLMFYSLKLKNSIYIFFMKRKRAMSDFSLWFPVYLLLL